MAKQLAGCLGTVLSLGSLSPAALAWTSTSSPMPRSSAIAQSLSTPATDAFCNAQRNAVTESAARAWLERSRSFSQAGKPDAGARALMRTLWLLQRSPDRRVRAEMLREITDNSPAGVLQVLVDQSVTLQDQEAGLSVLPLLLELTQTLPTDYSVVKTQSITAIAQHYIALGQSEAAPAILAQAVQAAQFLQGDEFQAKALTAIAQQYANLGDRDQTIALLDRALTFAQRVQHPNPLRRTWLLQPIAITYAKAGQFDQALAVVEQISDADEASAYARNEAIAAIVGAYAAANQIDPALALLERITQPEIKAVTLAKFAGAFGRAGGTTQSQTLLNQAIAIAEAAPNPGQRNSMLTQIALTYAEASGYATGALPVLALMEPASAQAQTLITLAGMETDASRATALLNQGLERARQIDDSAEQLTLFNQLIEANLGASRWAIALQIAQALPLDAPYADPYATMARIALQAAAGGDFSIALQATEALPDTWSDARNQGFRDIAIGYAKAGQFEQAMQMWQRITSDGSYAYQVRTLAAIAQASADQGNRNRANQLLEQATPLVDQFSFSNQRSDAFTALAIRYEVLGQATRAARLRSQAVQAATGADVVDSAYQLRQMIEQYVTAGQYAYAVQTAMVLSDAAGERSRTLSEIAARLIEAEQFDLAVQAANALTTPEDRTRFLVDVVNHYVADGNLEQAVATLDLALAAAQTIPGAETRMLVLREDLSVDDPFDRGSQLEAIALTYADLGNNDRAMQVAQSLQTAAIRNPLLQRLACYQS
ncbi:MAG TPA: tetratricopeptide repeat protein [Chroococcidiopsis sp.]